MSHTPGPWKRWNPRSVTMFLVVTEAGETVAEVMTDPETPECAADARLIAAAPELLEACQAVRRNLTKGFVQLNAHQLAYWKNIAESLLDTVIAKATE